MENQQNIFQVPQGNFKQMNAQLQETHAENQFQARVMAELRTEQEKFKAELVQARLKIDQMQNSRITHGVKVDALRIEPRKFEGYGDNSELWIREFETNLTN